MRNTNDVFPRLKSWMQAGLDEIGVELGDLREHNLRRKHRSKMKALDARRDQIFADKINQAVIGEVFTQGLRKKHMMKLLFYVFFIICITLCGVHETTRDENSAFFLRKGLEQAFVEDEFDFQVSRLLRNYEGIDSPDEFWLWTKSAFHGVLYPKEQQTPSADEISSYHEGDTMMRRPGGTYVGGHNLLLGVPRFRQVRSKTEPCDLHEEYKHLGQVCFSAIGGGDSEDTQSFGPNGMYSWRSEDELQGVNHWGQVETYPGSGFVVDFPSSEKEGSVNASVATLSLLDELQRNKWFDPKTRAVFVEFSLYNPDVNHFVVVSLTLESPPTGGIFVDSKFDVHRLIPYSLRDGVDAMVVLEIVCIVFLLYLFYEEICQIYAKRWGYFNIIYNYTDMLMHSIFFCIVGLRIQALLLEEDVDWENRESFLPLYRLARNCRTQAALFSLLVLLAWAKLVEYVSVFKIMSRLAVMIEMMLTKVKALVCLFIIVMLGFTSAEFIAYGYKKDNSYRWGYSLIFHMFYTFNGKEPVDVSELHKQPLDFFYTFLFTVIMVFVLLNLVIAILTAAYEEAENEGIVEMFYARMQFINIREELNDDGSKIEDCFRLVSWRDIIVCSEKSSVVQKCKCLPTLRETTNIERLFDHSPTLDNDGFEYIDVSDKRQTRPSRGVSSFYWYDEHQRNAREHAKDEFKTYPRARTDRWSAMGEGLPGDMLESIDVQLVHRPSHASSEE